MADTCLEHVECVLSSDEIDFNEDDGHTEIANRMIDKNLDGGWCLNTLRTRIGRLRRRDERVDDSSGDEQSDRPDTWEEWASEEDEDAGSAENVDYFKRDYYYNEYDDKYVIWPKNRAKSVVVDGEVVRSIKEDYSNWTGDVSTINEVCRTHQISRKDFVAIKRAFGFVHGDSPFTDEQLTDDDTTIDDHVKSLARKREREVEKAWQKKQWHQTEKEARKWRKFERGVVQPLFRQIDGTPVELTEIEVSEPDDFFAIPHVTDGHLDQQNADGTGLEVNRRRWLECLKKNLERVERFGVPEKIVLPLGGDQFNIDGPGGTTAGTPQDNSINGPGTFHQVANAGIEAIEMCRQVAPEVDVRVIVGNHDWRSAQAYHWGLQEKYSHIANVNVVGSATKWQVSLHGDNLCVWTHGDKVSGGETKQNWSLSAWLLNNAQDYLAEGPSHYYAFLGHLHHVLEKDDGVHTLQGGSSAKTDRWHRVNGYETSKACQTCYLLDKSGGQSVRFTAYPD